MADALTSLLAIGGLLTAKLAGWAFMDPVVGLVGTGVILSLVLRTGVAIGRHSPQFRTGPAPCRGDAPLARSQWRRRLGFAFVARRARPLRGHGIEFSPTIHSRPEDYKTMLTALTKLSHVTVEVERCPGHSRTAAR